MKVKVVGNDEMMMMTLKVLVTFIFNNGYDKNEVEVKNVAKRTYKQCLPYEQWARLSSFLGNAILLFGKVSLPFRGSVSTILYPRFARFSPPVLIITITF